MALLELVQGTERLGKKETEVSATGRVGAARSENDGLYLCS